MRKKSLLSLCLSATLVFQAFCSVPVVQQSKTEGTSKAVAKVSAATIDAEAAKNLTSAEDRFKWLYATMKDPNTGYFDENGVPYHSIEKLMIEAPDYGHESTSEAASYLVWLEAVNGRISGVWSGIDSAWNVIEKYFIPTDDLQPIQQYTPSSPATYAEEYDLPSGYPSQLQSGTPAGSDPLYEELKSTYNTNSMYGMHWLVDVDNFYGFSKDGIDAEDPVYINTFQRGKMEGCWNTIPQPSWEDFSYGGQSGFLPYFTGDSSYSKQWRYTIASDADARVVQAMYRANEWSDGAISSSSIDKTKKMGDYLRYSMYDKYFMKVGAQSPTAASGKDSCMYLLSWYYAWGGAEDGSWSWKIGSSHSHFGYQNPFAAWVLSEDSTGFVPKSATAQDDWENSFDRQMELYQWLQSDEGGIAGGCTNSMNGRYEKYDTDSTFYGMAYQEHPVYSNPGSNQWFGMQCWSMQRIAEVYYETGDERAKALMDKWVTWVESQLKMDSADEYLPGNLSWSGEPGKWDDKSKSSDNSNLHVTVTSWGHDVGISASLANTLCYYAAAQREHDPTQDYEKHFAIADQLLDKIWTYVDDKGLGDVSTWDEDKIALFYKEYTENADGTVSGVYVPNNYANGVMPYGDKIQPGASFYSIRANAFAAEVEREKAQNIDESTYNSLAYSMAGLESGEAFDLTYHRFWANCDAAIALGVYDELYDDFNAENGGNTSEDDNTTEGNQGGNNTTEGNQGGNNNTTEDNQGGNNNTTEGNQGGNNNTTEGNQGGNNNTTEGNQGGNNNTTEGNQGGNNNTTEGNQSGNNNTTEGNQGGNNNTTEGNQGGNNNTTEGNQGGNNNTTEGNQGGNNNTTEGNQGGNNNTTENNQGGNNNTTEGNQGGNNNTTEANQGSTDIAVNSITVNPPYVTMNPGDKKQLSVTIQPENATNKSISWSIDPQYADKAVVDSNGNVTAIAAGVAVVTATSSNGQQDTCTVIIEDNSSSNTTAQDPNAGNQGSTTTAQNPSSGNQGSNTTTQNSNSGNQGNTTTAQNPSSGNQSSTTTQNSNSGNQSSTTTAQNPSSGGQSGSTEITVSSVDIVEDIVHLKPYKHVTLTTNVLPANATNKDLTWTVTPSPSNVAIVNSNGMVTAISTGYVTVTATSSNGKSDTCIIVVDPEDTTTQDPGNNTTTQTPNTGNQGSNTTSQNPSTSDQGSSNTTSQNPSTGNQGSNTTSQNPSTGNQGSNTTSQNPSTGNQGSNTTSQNPSAGDQSGNNTTVQDPNAGNQGSNNTTAQNPTDGNNNASATTTQATNAGNNGATTTQAPSGTTETPAGPTENPLEPAVQDLGNNTYITNTTIIKGTIIKGSTLKYQITKNDASGKEARVYGASVSKLANVNVPNMIVINNDVYKVTSIKSKAFYNKASIKKITLGKNIKSIGTKAFYKCKKVKTVTIKTTKLTTKNVKSNAFGKMKAKMTIKVPKAKKAAYKKLLIKRGVSKKATIK